MDTIKKIKISDIDDFKNHPFLVNNDESLKDLANSIKDNGLLNPIIVRPKEDGRYEMISGHRRKAALGLLEEKEVNAIVKDLTDDEAIIYMVDSNMYRDKILPSEKARAYKMKMDAIKHQGRTLGPEGPKLRSDEIIASESPDGQTNVKRYIRLNYLIPEILQLVDNKVLYDKRSCLNIGLKPAVELSYLSKQEQEGVYSAMKYYDLTPSLGQANQLRELSKNKKLDYLAIENVLSEEKGNQHEQISFNKDRISDALPSNIKNTDKRTIEKYIIKAIVSYKEMNNQKEEYLSEDEEEFIL